MNTAARIRELLNRPENEDGLSPTSIAAALGITPRSVHGSLTRMPDAYLDRWKNVQMEKSVAQVSIWCCVKVPKNCPRPSQRNS